MNASSTSVRPLTPDDVAAIHAWPPYPPDLMPLDYAIRDGGWLEMFPASPHNVRLAVMHGGQLAGFTLLTDIDAGSAEFYVALHPERLHRGLGRRATEMTVAFGFEQLSLSRIYLKVRTWHLRAQRLYESLGFRPQGECDGEVQGIPTRFLKMERRRGG